MNGFVSKLINNLFKRAKARPAVARRATPGMEPLEMRALLATVMPSPITVADDVIVDGRIITGENYDSARAGGGGGAGKVQMQDIHFGASVARSSAHHGGVNVALGDGSVRFVRDSVSTLGTWAAPRAGTHGSGGGGGAGKVSMQDISFTLPSAGGDRVDDVIVSAGGAPGGHVKVFSGASGAELASFYAFGAGFSGGVNVSAASQSGGFRGGISVGAGDVEGDAGLDHHGHGTHVAGTIGASGGAGSIGGHVKVFDGRSSAAGSTKVVVGIIDTGIDYSDANLIKNIWINQDLERLIDDLASDVASQGGQPYKLASGGYVKVSAD